ncbi:AIPR family protein [Variovorax paradoxus]|uniref:AIPR family protein n=1 Tax=Variovorax paradoxus TaxID=34073 RepID=UPI003ED0D052
MAKNDAILLDGIVDEKMKAEFRDRGEAFELLAFEQILKSFDLTQEEVDAGWVDGRNDGGIDGFFTFLNGILVRNIESQIWPRKGAAIDIWIISCKHKDSFKQETFNTIIPTIEELLDFGKDPSEFEGKYSNELIAARQIAAQVYQRTASSLPSIHFHVGYACRGDISDLEENVRARGNQIERLINDYFSGAKVDVEYFGASELIELHRKNRVILELTYSELLTSGQDAYVLLVPMDAYANFIRDENNNLRRYLFDSNVRDFLGQSRVNQDISNTLQNPEGPNFWWLNNGVTILATQAVQLGRTQRGSALQLHDVQIVNGLQTTQSIHNHYGDSHRLMAEESKRQVLVKVIVSDDVDVRDSIIQATNNQNTVELAALNATDKIQRDIEMILERHGWYYERRKNYYKNIGKPADRFITPLYLATAFTAIVHRAPHISGWLKSRFMRNESSYAAIFSDQVPIELWPKIAEIMRATEVAMQAPLSRIVARPIRMQGVWRGAVAICALGKIHGSFDLPPAKLMVTDTSKISKDLIAEILQNISGGSSANAQTLTRDGRRLDDICKRFGEEEGIENWQSIGKWSIPYASQSVRLKPKKAAAPLPSSPESKITAPMSKEFLDAIDALLPQQPWPPGIQEMLVQALSSDRKTVRAGIDKLIEDGRRYNQHHGVVVDKDGTIVALDELRANRNFRIGEKYSAA